MPITTTEEPTTTTVPTTTTEEETSTTQKPTTTTVSTTSTEKETTTYVNRYVMRGWCYRPGMVCDLFVQDYSWGRVCGMMVSVLFFGGCGEFFWCRDVHLVIIFEGVSVLVGMQDVGDWVEA